MVRSRETRRKSPCRKLGTPTVEASRAIAADIADRTRQMQTLAEAMARSTTIKDELLAELDHVQGRQRDAAGQVQASEDQLSRAEAMLKQLEQRRAQLTFGEKKLAAIEPPSWRSSRSPTTSTRASRSSPSREQLVSAVKAEVTDGSRD